jgi:hypothetical protein
MADYDIGYGKPPRGKRFEPGKSGNPGGRPKDEPDRLGEIVQEVLDAPMQYRQNGRTKTATRREVGLRLLVEKAVKGDVGAAELLLKKRRHALRHGQNGARRLVVTDWLPDYPGQTAEEKTAAMAAQMAAVPLRRRSGRRPDGQENGVAPAGSAPQAQEG